MSLPPGMGGDGAAGPRAIRPYLNAPHRPEPEPAADPRSGDPPAAALRPFVLTSGRVDGPDPAIAMETQVTARPEGSRVPTARLAPELRAIVTLCAEPVSVAEISSRLRLHLGVVKVLVGDLRAAGYLDVHNQDVPTTPDLILRVIRGLSAIT